MAGKSWARGSWSSRIWSAAPCARMAPASSTFSAGRCGCGRRPAPRRCRSRGRRGGRRRRCRAPGATPPQVRLRRAAGEPAGELIPPPRRRGRRRRRRWPLPAPVEPRTDDDGRGISIMARRAMDSRVRPARRGRKMSPLVRLTSNSASWLRADAPAAAGAAAAGQAGSVRSAADVSPNSAEERLDVAGPRSRRG